MKKIRFISKLIPIALFTFVLSCNTEEEAPQTRIEKNVGAKVTTDAEQLPDVTADRILVVELEGMVCEMGCGGSIRKELYNSDAVASVSFEFDENKAVDVAYVAYDRDLITADGLISIIAAANDGQYKVITTRSEAYVSDSFSDESEETSDAPATKKSKVSIKTASTSLSAGVFDLFSWL